jgi:hypothetical protein
MDELCPISHEVESRADLIKNVAAYLCQRPEELIDTQRLLRRFRVSASEFSQALVLFERQPMLESDGI